MSENPNTTPNPSENGWQDVGKQFEALGESLAQAVRSAWQNEESQRTLNDMRTGLESMARDVGKAIEDSANSPEGQRFREKAEHTVDNLKVAGAQTVQDARPHLLKALEQLNLEVQKLIQHIEKKNGEG